MADTTLDVWAARLDVPDTDVDRYRPTLDARELARVDRLRQDVDKRDYIVSHGILRAILGKYATIDPAAVTFTYGPHGKPYLANAFDQDASVMSPQNWGLGGQRIEFNMSDSKGLLLVAVSSGVAVGVDIEKRRPIEIIKFARRFFTSTEADAIEALPESAREEAFFRTWTCKEGYVKGWGFGIQRHVGTFDVRVGEAKSGLLTCAFDETSPDRWSLVNIDAIPGYAATVAVERPGVESVEVRWWGVGGE